MAYGPSMSHPSIQSHLAEQNEHALYGNTQKTTRSIIAREKEHPNNCFALARIYQIFDASYIFSN